MSRRPTPCPRKLKVFLTKHALARVKTRGVTPEQVVAAVSTGREIPSEFVGEQGGFISKFYKSFVIRQNGVPITISVVAVCECFQDRYVLLSAYQDNCRK